MDPTPNTDIRGLTSFQTRHRSLTFQEGTFLAKSPYSFSPLPSSTTLPRSPSSNTLRSRLPSSQSLAVIKPYPSTLLREEVPKPWAGKKSRAARWEPVIFCSIFALACLGGGALCYLGVRQIPQIGKLCLVMDDDFSTGSINQEYWTHEVRTDGFGNNEFEWTTMSTNNSFVEDSTLYIVPTLTADNIGNDNVNNGYNLNLTLDGSCTSPNVTDCAVVSNSSTGSIINPIQSARLITKNKVGIKYGKVEVVARMPAGDWLWPAIWMLPTEEKYGAWPASGEIDIVEARGNGFDYPQNGYNHVQSALHWGPYSVFDSYIKTLGIRKNKVKGFHSDYHTYSLEWDENYLTTYVDSRVYSIMDLKMGQDFWEKGKFPAFWQNGSETVTLSNPWVSGTPGVAPFDQSFYLILNVAVGGTNGYFPDGVGKKPWVDTSATAMRDFWVAKDKWFPSWPQDPKQRGLAVKSVKMWQKC